MVDLTFRTTLLLSIAAYIVFVLVRPPAPVDASRLVDRPADAARSFNYNTFTTADGLELKFIEKGDKGEKGTVVFLHGFPETAAVSWGAFVDDFAARGYHVLAPDQRGYNDSARPETVAAYDMALLTADMSDLIAKHAVGGRASVVGHDWGAAVAWSVGLTNPERVERLVVCNVPHPHAMRDALMGGSWRQMLRSWYIFWFQVPVLPETLLARADGTPLVRAVVNTAAPGTFSTHEVATLRAAWRKGISPLLNWYRASVRAVGGPSLPHGPVVQVPTHIVWGKHDHALGPELVQPSLDLTADGGVTWVDASHWVQHEQFDIVSRAIGAFIASGERVPGVAAPEIP